MNKKEQAEFDSLREQLRIAKALRYTEPVQPDVPIPESGLSKGWLFNSHREYERVVRACSSKVGHSFGRDDATDSQWPQRLFSTRLLALRACRNEMEQRFAKKLADLDQEIEAEQSEQGA